MLDIHLRENLGWMVRYSCELAESRTDECSFATDSVFTGRVVQVWLWRRPGSGHYRVAEYTRTLAHRFRRIYACSSASLDAASIMTDAAPLA